MLFNETCGHEYVLVGLVWMNVSNSEELEGGRYINKNFFVTQYLLLSIDACRSVLCSAIFPCGCLTIAVNLNYQNIFLSSVSDSLIKLKRPTKNGGEFCILEKK